MAHYWQEIGALTMRWVRRLSREKFSMLFTLVQPMLFWLIFFGNLFQLVDFDDERDLAGEAFGIPIIVSDGLVENESAINPTTTTTTPSSQV